MTSKTKSIDHGFNTVGIAQRAGKDFVDDENLITCIIIDVLAELTTVTTGAAKRAFHMPWAFTVTDVALGLSVVSSSGIVRCDLNEGAGAGTSIFSTRPSIDASELHSSTGTVAVISDTSIAKYARMTIDVDDAGTGAKGLKMYIYGRADTTA